MQRHVLETCTTLAVLAEHDGEIPCITCTVSVPKACQAPPWAVHDLEAVLDRETRATHWAAVKTVLRAPREKAAAAQSLAAAEAAAAAPGLERMERVAQLRNIISDADLTLKCPRCPARFNDYVGCNALHCTSCGCGFCGICLLDCGFDAHNHYRMTHDEEIFNRPLFERTHREARLNRVVARLRGLAPDVDVQCDLITALTGDLHDLHIDAADVMRMVSEDWPAALRLQRQVALAVKTLQVHGYHANITANACAALVNATIIPAGQIAAVEGGAPRAIVTAVLAHLNNAAVVRNGTAALSFIVMLPAGQQAAVDANAPGVIIAALRAHTRDVDIACSVTAALSSIARIPAGKRAVCDADALREIANTVHVHLGNAVIIKYAREALAVIQPPGVRIIA